MADTWYCVKCGRNHREGGMVAWHHGGLRPDGSYDLEPETVAIGIAMADAASESRSGNSATLGAIEDSFEDLGLRRAFPDLDVRDTLWALKERHLIGQVRHSGRQHFQFLANKGGGPQGVLAAELLDGDEVVPARVRELADPVAAPSASR